MVVRSGLQLRQSPPPQWPPSQQQVGWSWNVPWRASRQYNPAGWQRGRGAVVPDNAEQKPALLLCVRVGIMGYQKENRLQKRVSKRVDESMATV